MDLPTVQEALEFVASHPSMDLLMSRRPPYPRKDIRLQIKMWRSQRVLWAHAADKRADAKEEREE
jgi:hypothetical protein